MSWRFLAQNNLKCSEGKGHTFESCRVRHPLRTLSFVTEGRGCFITSDGCWYRRGTIVGNDLLEWRSCSLNGHESTSDRSLQARKFRLGLRTLEPYPLAFLVRIEKFWESGRSSLQPFSDRKSQPDFRARIRELGLAVRSVSCSRWIA